MIFLAINPVDSVFCLRTTVAWAQMGVPPYMGFIGMCEPKRDVFLDVLDKMVSILAILLLKRALDLHSSLELGIFFRRIYFFIRIDKTINKTIGNKRTKERGKQ